MTIIAVKNGIMAADSLCLRSHTRIPMTEGDKKIVRAPDGSLVGSCGSAVDCYALNQWAIAGMDFKAPPRFSYAAPDHEDAVDWMWLKTDGSVWRGDACLNLHPVPSSSSLGAYPAWAFADSAMYLGLSAEAAVRHAMRYCERIGGEVQVERVSGAVPTMQEYWERFKAGKLRPTTLGFVP